jgi:diguanylate cyclase (GGDEF)-like protein
MPDSIRQGDLALDQPGSVGPETLRLAGAFAALVVAVAVAMAFFRAVQLPALPQFATLHAGFVLVVDGIVAFLLFGQFAYRRQVSYAVLGAAYLFSALVAIPFLLAFPGALKAEGSVIGGPQSSAWVWHAWHMVFPLIVGLSVLAHERAAGRTVAVERVVPAIGRTVAATAALALLVTVAVTVFHGRLPVLLTPGPQPLTPAFYAVGGAAAVLAAGALGLAVWAARRRSVLHVWLAVALTAFLADALMSLMSTGRYSMGWYGGRVESMAAAGVLLLVFLGGINRLYYKLGVTVRDLFVANRKLAALVREKEALVDALQRRENEIRQLAYYDPVTELPNRRMLMDRLNHDLAQGGRLGHSTALLFLDLDRFKAINDQFGHEAGDTLLREVGARLSRCVRSSDTVSRLGGDEFVIVLPQITDPEEAICAAEKVINSLSQPVTVAGQRFDVTTSIGIAIAPPGVGQDAGGLLARADAAMYAAKRAGRNCFRFGDEPGRQAPPLTGIPL